MTANRIRALRKERGYSQKELGDRLGVGQTTVSAWEIGRNEPDNDLSNKMAKLFGCSIGYLMGYENESPHRGLSKADWDAYTDALRQEHLHQASDAQQGEDPSIEEYQRQQILMDWERNERSIFPESVYIDKILESTDEDGRKRALQVIQLMFP